MNAETFDFSSRIEEIWRVGETLGLSFSEVHHVFRAVLAEKHEKETKDSLGRSCETETKASRKNFTWKFSSDVPAEEEEMRETEHQPGHLCEKQEEISKLELKFKIFSVLKFLFKILACMVKFMQKISSAIKTLLKVVTCVVTIGIIFCTIISLHNPTKKFVTRNIQDFIYPVMSTLRQVTLPVLKKYPHLSQWYSEECLVPNVLFNHGSIDCTTCEENLGLIKISNLKNFTGSYYNTGKYLVVNDAVHSVVSKTVFFENIDVHQEIELGAWKQIPKHSTFLYTSEQLTDKDHTDIHIEWSINKLETLHLIRQVFPRPYFIPQDTEVALHRSIFIDGPDSKPYSLPLPEFANIVIMQGEGESVFSMLPSSQCKGHCSPAVITLKPTQVLFYNWIYWRPERLKSGFSSTFGMSSFY